VSRRTERLVGNCHARHGCNEVNAPGGLLIPDRRGIACSDRAVALRGDRNADHRARARRNPPGQSVPPREAPVRRARRSSVSILICNPKISVRAVRDRVASVKANPSNRRDDLTPAAGACSPTNAPGAGGKIRAGRCRARDSPRHLLRQDGPTSPAGTGPRGADVALHGGPCRRPVDGLDPAHDAVVIHEVPRPGPALEDIGDPVRWDDSGFPADPPR
jgi:hypothetical protein